MVPTSRFWIVCRDNFASLARCFCVKPMSFRRALIILPAVLISISAPSYASICALSHVRKVYAIFGQSQFSLNLDTGRAPWVWDNPCCTSKQDICGAIFKKKRYGRAAVPLLVVYFRATSQWSWGRLLLAQGSDSLPRLLPIQNLHLRIIFPMYLGESLHL